MRPKNTHGGSRGGGRPKKLEEEKKGKNITFRPSSEVAKILELQANKTLFIECAILAYNVRLFEKQETVII